MHRKIVASIFSEIRAIPIDEHYWGGAFFDLPHDRIVSTVFMNLALDLERRHRLYDELVYHAEKAGMKSAVKQYEKLRDSSEWDGWEHYSVMSEMMRSNLRNDLVTLALIVGAVVLVGVALALWLLL